MATRVISMAPLKGGSTKTSTSLQLLGSYAKKKKRVLAIDLDSQKNLSNFLEQEEDESEHNIYDLIVGNEKARYAIKESKFKNIDYIPGSHRLGERGVYVDDMSLKEIVGSVSDIYDYVVIDNAPTLTSGAISSFVASDAIIVTTELDKFSFENIVRMINSIVEYNGDAEIFITPAKAITNSKAHKQLRGELEDFVKDVDYLHLTDSIPFSVEMTNRLIEDEILVQHKALSQSHRNLKKALEKLAKEVK